MITFYDSGIGGLTILDEFLRQLPSLNYQYFSDNGPKSVVANSDYSDSKVLDFQYYADLEFMPLGDKSRQQIVDRIKTVATLAFQNSNLMILACNSASVNTIRELQQNWLPKHFPNKQILSISKPITELLYSEYSDKKTKRLVILSTQTTVDSGFYQKEFADIGFKNLVAIPCSGLADLIEELIIGNKDKFDIATKSQFLNKNMIIALLAELNKTKNTQTTQKIEDYLTNLKIPTNSIILLACTHYPIIKDFIKTIYPSCIVLDPSEFIASKLINYIYQHTEF
jgi:glutamate racemase